MFQTSLNVQRYHIYVDLDLWQCMHCDNRRLEIPETGTLELFAKCVCGVSLSIADNPAFKNAQLTGVLEAFLDAS